MQIQTIIIAQMMSTGGEEEARPILCHRLLTICGRFVFSSFAIIVSNFGNVPGE